MLSFSCHSFWTSPTPTSSHCDITILCAGLANAGAAEKAFTSFDGKDIDGRKVLAVFDDKNAKLRSKSELPIGSKSMLTYNAAARCGLYDGTSGTVMGKGSHDSKESHGSTSSSTVLTATTSLLDPSCI
jgi:hypothetical protein